MRLVPMILVLALALQACGIKGPLYLPAKPAPAASAPESPRERESR